MKTKLPEAIKTIEEAENFLSALHENGESFHPEDDAHDIIWNSIPEEHKPTKAECDQLNKLMTDIYEIDGNDVNTGFDPCGYLLDLIGEEERRDKLARPSEY